MVRTEKEFGEVFARKLTPDCDHYRADRERFHIIEVEMGYEVPQLDVRLSLQIFDDVDGRAPAVQRDRALILTREDVERLGIGIEDEEAQQ